MENESISVLIIDADGASRTYLSSNLEKAGYHTMTAPSGKEGLILAWQHVPQVIIIDPILPDLGATDLITRLRQDRRTSKVPCIAISEHVEASGVNQLLAAGFNEYLGKSNQVIGLLLEMIARFFKEEHPIQKGGALFVFLSAKGGTGTSSLCANIAMCLAKATSTLRVAVLDLVLPIGSIAPIVGCEERMNIVNVSAQNPDQLTPAFFKESLPRLPVWYFRLLAGSPDPDAANELHVERLGGILAAIQESYDYVFVDLGRALSRISLPIIHKADLLALVLSTDASCVSLTRTIWDYLKAQDIQPKRMYPILNRVVGLEGMNKVDIETALGLQMRTVMPFMGGNFGLANNQHQPIAVKFPGDSGALTVMQAASQMSDLSRRLKGA